MLTLKMEIAEMNKTGISLPNNESSEEDQKMIKEL